MIKIKKGVKLNGMTPEMLLAIIIADQVYTEYGFECWITSCTDGLHGFGSAHYTGNGVDLRTRNITRGKYQDRKKQKAICDEIRRRLGKNYDVALESNHAHIEFQPK